MNQPTPASHALRLQPFGEQADAHPTTKAIAAPLIRTFHPPGTKASIVIAAITG